MEESAKLVLMTASGVQHEVPVELCGGMQQVPESDAHALTWVLTTALHKLVSQVTGDNSPQPDVTAQLIEADWRTRVIMESLRGQLQAAHDLLADLQIPWDKKIWEATVRTMQEHEASLAVMRKRYGSFMRNPQGAPWGTDPASKPPAGSAVPVESVTKKVKKGRKVK